MQADQGDTKQTKHGIPGSCGIGVNDNDQVWDEQLSQRLNRATHQPCHSSDVPQLRQLLLGELRMLYHHPPRLRTLSHCNTP
jgi:hypothetical protein